MYLAEATVGSNSCTEQQGCWQHTSKTISDSSCNGVYACSEFNGPDATIGLTTTGNFENGGSCQGFKSCEFARSTIGAAACIEQEACYNTGATLLHDGCCVGEFSCSSAFQAGQTCGTSIAGDVDPAASCIGYASCFNSQANIGAASCLSRLSCYNVNASGRLCLRVVLWTVGRGRELPLRVSPRALPVQLRSNQALALDRHPVKAPVEITLEVLPVSWNRVASTLRDQLAMIPAVPH